MKKKEEKEGVLRDKKPGDRVLLMDERFLAEHLFTTNIMSTLGGRIVTIRSMDKYADGSLFRVEEDNGLYLWAADMVDIF